VEEKSPFGTLKEKRAMERKSLFRFLRKMYLRKESVKNKN
jgi:hypothetical protein